MGTAFPKGVMRKIAPKNKYAPNESGHTSLYHAAGF